MMKTNPIQYPYWENVARYELHEQTTRLSLITWLIAVSSVILIVWIFITVRLIIKVSPRESKKHSVDIVETIGA